LEGNTPLVLSLPAEGEATSWTIQAQVLWYNRGAVERKYQFDVGLQFVKLSAEQRQHLEVLCRSAASP
jgi:hypothetical protein